MLHWPSQGHTNRELSSHLCFFYAVSSLLRFAKLQWLHSHPALTGSKKPVCADQGFKLILTMSGWWNYSLFIPFTCEKSLWIILSQQEPQNQWFSIGLSYSGMSGPIFIVMYTCCDAGEKKRAGSHEKYLNNYLSKGFFFHSASTWVPFCAAMLQVSP